MEFGKFKYAFNTKIQYYMNDKYYFAALKKWPNKDDMELAIKIELQKRYRPELEKILKELYVPASKKKFTVEEMLTDPKYMSNLTGTFRPKMLEYVKGETKKIELNGISFSLRVT